MEATAITAMFAGIGLRSILSAIVIFLLCLIVIQIITRITDKLLSRSAHANATVKNFLRTTVKIGLWVIAIVIICGTLGIPTASLVAVISVAGLALSLSVQNIMTNIFSGITLLLNHPFKEGDLVDIGANSGVIQHVGLFYTVLNTLDNRVVSIPNGDITGAAIVNYSTEPLRRVDMTFSTSYDDATETVKAAIREAIAMDSRIAADPAPFIVLSQYKDSCIEYIVRVWCKNADYWDVYFGLNENVRECFARHGVQMTYNHINVHMMEK